MASLILIAILVPAVSVSASWPEVRLEQVIALGAAVWLVFVWWRSGRPLRPMPLDLLFLAFGLSVLASTVYAPIVLDSAFSPRDLYEVMKVGLYWVLFRLGWEVARRDGQTAPRAALRALLAGGTLAGLFGLAQYYNLLDINDWATPAWAPAHHLRTLALDARAVGTVGNPNYFGMLSALVMLAAVARLAFGAAGRDRLLCAAALGGGAIGLVTSASRGAAIAFVAGLVAIWVVVLWLRPAPAAGRRPRRALVATGGAALALLLCIGLVEAAPRGRTDYLTRMAGSFGGDGDGSLALRLERWRGMLHWTGGTAEPAPGISAAVTYIENGSLERGDAHADGFRAIPGTRYELTDADARFDARSARFFGNPEDPDQRAAIFQQRYLGRRVSTPLTASLWVKLPAPVSGDLSLWVNVYYADGGRADPLAVAPIDPARTGVWQQFTVTARPDPDRTVTFAGVYLMAEGFRGEALVDGFQLVEGEQPAAFESLSVLSGSSGAPDAGATLRASPVFGGGPAKAVETGAVDNEYLTIAARYGLLGLGLYLALWGVVAVTALRGIRHATDPSAVALCAAVPAAVVAFLVFNLVAGSFLHLQLMAVFWPLAGIALACAARPKAAPAVSH